MAVEFKAKIWVKVVADADGLEADPTIAAGVIENFLNSYTGEIDYKGKKYYISGGTVTVLP